VDTLTEVTVVSSLRQHSEYTHKHNAGFGRHGWLRLTPAYSVKIVQEILLDAPTASRVLDPFAGTATTALCAASRGHDAATTEINPFLVWFARTKTARYTLAQVAAARRAARTALADAAPSRARSIAPPAIYNVERWWNPSELGFLCSLKANLEACVRTNEVSRALLMVAFCRTLIGLSNAAFNHQSMSFRDQDRNLTLFDDGGRREAYVDLFMRDVDFVLDSALHNPTGHVVVIEGDARRVSELVSGLYDLVVTSPPYPNRMSYIRELRPYMYWLDFLKDSRDAAEIDWASIGGTWGAATSRLSEWQASADSFRPRYLDEIVHRIADPHHISGRLLSNYVLKYFEDMFVHLGSLRKVLSPGARIHYVIGNSTFYGVLLPVERLYADMMSALGFSEVSIRPLRKRSSKRELIEFDVCARWNP
jgi:hypothetical protein